MSGIFRSLQHRTAQMISPPVAAIVPWKRCGTLRRVAADSTSPIALDRGLGVVLDAEGEGEVERSSVSACREMFE